MSNSSSLTLQNASDLDNDLFNNKLCVSGSILPFNQDDLIDTNNRLDDSSSQFEVRQYSYSPYELDMAVKRFLINKTKNKWKRISRRYNNGYIDKLIKEAKILHQLKHSNDIVEFYGLFIDGDYALLCMELMDMNLSKLNGIFINSGWAYLQSNTYIRSIVVPVIDGIEYCHGKKIIHRDIKPDNILFKRNGKIKVGDFSESRAVDATIIEKFNGTMYYWPPERVRSTEVKDPKYDIWSLGMTLLEIICGFHPYEKLLGRNPDMITLKQFIENVDPETLLKCAHIQKENENSNYDEENNKYEYYDYTKKYADELKLISRCLKRVNERATIDELKNSPYYKHAQKERNEAHIREMFRGYEEIYRTLFEHNFRKLDTLIFEENIGEYNFEYSELKFRLFLNRNESSENEVQICYYTQADKWLMLKNYFKEFNSIKFMIHELTFLHNFAGQPFIPKFYGWASIEHNTRSTHIICTEVMDMNLRQFNNHFINNFGSEAFKQALLEGILGYISCMVLNALLEIHLKGFAHYNINYNNILLNDRGEIKLCGFKCSRRLEDNASSYYYKDERLRLLCDVLNPHPDGNNCLSYPSDVWSYAATFIEFACRHPPSLIPVNAAHDDIFYPRLSTDSLEENMLKWMSANIFSRGHFHRSHEFFMECLEQKKEPNFEVLLKMDFYQQALKNIEENKARLAKWIQEIIIKQTRIEQTVPVEWFHKFMNPESAKIYDTSNDLQEEFEQNFRKLDTLIFEENIGEYNFAYLELKFRLFLTRNEQSENEVQICYYTQADKWIILKNYAKTPLRIKSMIHELTFFHKFAGQPFIPKFYGWGSIEHNTRSTYVICTEVMDMNLRQFCNQFMYSFGFEVFKQALSKGILGYISCMVLNALLEIHLKGFALRNINSNNILLNSCGEIKLCGFKYARKHEDNYKWISYRDNDCQSIPSDVWSYAETFIEFAYGHAWFDELHDFYPRLYIFPKENELKEMSEDCFSEGYSHQPHEFFMECLEQQKKPNFKVLLKMDFYQQALKNIKENKERLAKWIQAIIIEETKIEHAVPVKWFHKFMDPENAKMYDTSNDLEEILGDDYPYVFD